MNAQLTSSVFPPPVEDRLAWVGANRSSIAPQVMAKAEQVLETPTPYVGLADWHHWWTTGERLDAERRHNQRRYRLLSLTLAAAMASDRRFLAGIERELAAILDEPTWVHVAHDVDYRDDRILDPERPAVDLFSAMTCQTLAEVDAIIGTWLDPALRDRARRMTRQRGVEFFLARDDYRWQTGQNAPNWLAVCAGAIAIAALIQETDKATLDAVLAKAERCFDQYFATFPTDGGCLEGLGYWEKSMAYVAMLGDMIERKRTGGWSPLNDPRVVAIADFPARIALAPGQYPAFSDTGVTRKPQAALLHFLARRLDRPVLFALDQTAPRDRLWTKRPAGEKLRDLFWYASSSRALVLPEHDFLPESQWFVARHDAGKLAMAIKGGHNAEPHNQNDVGSFVVTHACETVIAELGAPRYHRDYFQPDKRYTFLAARSSGHSVPLVNGVEQAPGKTFSAGGISRIERQEDGIAIDGLALDLMPAYPATADLLRLERRLEIVRAGTGIIRLTDEAAFKSKPGVLTSVLVTHGVVTPASPGECEITIGAARLSIRYDQTCVQLDVVEDHEVSLRDAPNPVRRLLFHHNAAERAVIQLTLCPAA